MAHQDYILNLGKPRGHEEGIVGWVYTHRVRLRSAVKSVAILVALYFALKLFIWVSLKFTFLIPVSAVAAFALGIAQVSITVTLIAVGAVAVLGLIGVSLSIAFRALGRVIN